MPSKTLALLLPLNRWNNLISFFVFSLVLLSVPAWAETEKTESHVVVAKFGSELEERVSDIQEVYRNQGVDAVVGMIEGDLKGSQRKLEFWQQVAKGSEVVVRSIDIHPSEKKAIEWLNLRLDRMGLSSVSFEGIEDESKPDPTALPKDEIKSKKWLRYLAGPGVALAASAYKVINSPGSSTTDYVYMIVPAVGVGTVTVLLELQFAWPWLNKVFWTKVWRFGGPVVGRLINVLVNTLYGMALYGASAAGTYASVSWGADPSLFSLMDLTTAMTSAATGGLIFHAAMGQYQTDISTEEKRGSISGVKRYGMEAGGVVVNGGSRAMDWVVPGQWDVWAQGGFFLLKTLPQLIKSNIEPRIRDAKIRDRLLPEETPKKSFFRRCVNAFSALELINLPRLQKE